METTMGSIRISALVVYVEVGLLLLISVGVLRTTQEVRLTSLRSILRSTEYIPGLVLSRFGPYIRST